MMRYENVRDRFDAFQAARTACSREWELSMNTVMCLELDVGPAALRVDLEASRINVGPSLVRITYYDVSMEPPVGMSAAMLSVGERGRSEIISASVERWRCGELSDLPPSTSSKLISKVRCRANKVSR